MFNPTKTARKSLAGALIALMTLGVAPTGVAFWSGAINRAAGTVKIIADYRDDMISPTFPGHTSVLGAFIFSVGSEKLNLTKLGLTINNSAGEENIATTAWLVDEAGRQISRYAQVRSDGRVTLFVDRGGLPEIHEEASIRLCGYKPTHTPQSR
ncbi:hypothetical protein CO046_02760 [Candidatus Peregrinibacteria bacterium CG_4_9_14_0_2_um_filter_53_11]|nr:MAG: hypothetical protein CO046_02760 [Candidatus Peregrinibacteria bacterium CG_4_9_14_0_2_um_filter_53_11]